MDVTWQCPDHGSPGSFRDSSSPLICECGCSYPRVTGVLDFLQRGSYADAFGLQWRRWSRIQFDSSTGSSISARRLQEALAADGFAELPGRRVLEVGCGSGRFTEVLLERGAQVVSVDLSAAAFENAKNFPPSPQHTVLRADLGALPLASCQFDLVLALGVVQHTPSTQQALRNLWKMVSPGGLMVFDHYALQLSHVLRLKPIYRQYLKRQPPERAMRVTDALYGIWSPVHKKFSGRFGRLILTRISPIVFFTSEFPELSDQDREAWGRLDTYDSLTDWYKHRLTRGQIRRAVEELKPVELDVAAGGTGWLVRARKST